MLERPDDGEADAGPRKSGPERLCIATRTVKPVGEMVRFVVGPDTAIVQDVKAKLPGRGVWVTASRSALATAVSRKAFGRSFRRDVKVPADLVNVTEGLLARSVLDALAMAHKSGRVAAGFAKVEAALAHEPVLALVHAADGEELVVGLERRPGGAARGRRPHAGGGPESRRGGEILRPVARRPIKVATLLPRTTQGRPVRFQLLVPPSVVSSRVISNHKH